MLTIAVVAGGCSLVAANAVSRLPSVWAPVSSIAVLWLGLLAAVGYALIRACPAGLLRLRGIDVMWGVVAGLALRLLQGWVGAADAAPFPTISGSARLVDLQWWVTEALPAGLIGPVVEEFFFRAVVLVAVYQMFRRSLGYAAASVTAVLASAGGFVLLHTTLVPLILTDALQLFFVGATMAGLVLLTGRLWPAVFAHIVYNVSFLGLMIIGTLWS